MAKAPSLKPTIFLASSLEGLELAYAIQENLENDAEIVLWWESFTPGTLTFHSLLETLKSSDFAVIGLTTDDFSSRRAPDDSARNLLFQTGLYVGVLGLNRTFLMVPEKKHLPSDLSGVSYFSFDPSRDLTQAVRRACVYIRAEIRRLKFREEKQNQPSRKSPKKKKPGLKARGGKRTRSRRAAAPDQKQVFISYSHKDKRWLEKLRTLLVPSVESNAIFLWDDSMIKPGDDWEKKIESALNTARVAVLLVSPDFLASRFISKVELPPLLDGAKKKGIRILWLYLRACDYEQTAIAKYQAAHDISRPLKALASAKQDQELLNIVKKINAAR